MLMCVTKKQKNAVLCFMVWELVSEIHTKKRREKTAYFHQSAKKNVHTYTGIQKNPLSCTLNLGQQWSNSSPW